MEMGTARPYAVKCLDAVGKAKLGALVVFFFKTMVKTER